MDNQLNCPRIDRWFGSCRFEPRYSVDIPIKNLEAMGAHLDLMNEYQLEALSSETYICDVCIRCGKMVKP